MANLRTAMDAAFHDLNVATPQTLHGSARAIPGEPLPLDNTRASRALRIQQLSLMGLGFPLGIIPSWAPPSQKGLGSFSLQSLLFKHATQNWWLGLVGQFRPKKLISSLKAEVYGDDWEVPTFKDVAKHFLDKSLYSVGICTQLALSSATNLLLSTEGDGQRNKRQNRFMLFHKLPNHDLTLEAAWPELFVDHKGKYWDVPESISLDCLSFVSESGLRYRLGIHKNGGQPQARDSGSNEAPVSLMPGVCAKGAFSYEKSRDLWRQPETKEDLIIETPRGRFWHPAYDFCLKEPFAAVSGIIGGTCEAWLGRSKGRKPFDVDLFGSTCYTIQHGKFRKPFGDFTRFDARLDVSSASSLAKRLSKIFRTSSNNEENLLSSPRLTLILQQQIAGPIVFRVDTRFSLFSSSEKRGPHLEDLVYSLNYSLRLLQSGKVIAWYSPKRKEGMIELRLFEF